MQPEANIPESETGEKPQPPLRGEGLLEPARGYGPEKQKKRLAEVQRKRMLFRKDVRSVLARAEESLEAPGPWSVERALAAFRTCTWCKASDEGEGEIFLEPASDVIIHDVRADENSFDSPPGQGQYVRAQDILGVSGVDQSLTVRTTMGTLTLERARPKS